MNHNRAAIKLLTDRYSAHIRSFNFLPVSEADSDEQYFLYKDLEALATTVLTRAELVRPTGNRVALLPSTDLGNVYVALRREFTDVERQKYNDIQNRLNELSDKYE